MNLKFEDLGEIWMNGEFDAKSALTLRNDILAHASMGPNFPIIIYINSYGGSVDALNSIIDTIDSIPNKVITVCSGTAMSCGAVLLAYGDERYCGANSRVMVHQVSHGTWGTVAETDSSVKEARRLNRGLFKIIADKTGKDVAELATIFSDNIDKFFSASEAKSFGLVDKIGMPRLEQEVIYKVVK